MAKIVAVNGDEDVLVVTNLGIIIRTSLKQVNVSGRNTLGVRIIKLSNDQKVSSLCVTEAYDEESNEVINGNLDNNETEQKNVDENDIIENSETNETLDEQIENDNNDVEE